MFQMKMKDKEQVGKPTNDNSLDEEVIFDLVSLHLRKKRIRLEDEFSLSEINSLSDHRILGSARCYKILP
jgi:hypothetical protein